MVILKGFRINSLYILEGSTVIGEVSVSSSASENKTRLWHLRLRHISQKSLIELSKLGLLGEDKIKDLRFFEDCVLRKSTRTSIRVSTHISKGILDYVHFDLWGPVQVMSLDGAR